MLAMATDIRAWEIVTFVVSICAGVIGGLVLFNLSGMRETISRLSAKLDEQDKKILDLYNRKNMCSQDYVPMVAYIRSTNNLEEGQKELIQGVANLQGIMESIKQMPQICGTIAREIVKEMKNG